MRIRQYLFNKGYTPLKGDNNCTLYIKNLMPNKDCFYSTFIKLDDKTLEIKDYGVNVSAQIKNINDFKVLYRLYKEFDKIIENIENKRTD